MATSTTTKTGERRDLLARRLVAHGLDRDSGDLADLQLALCGFQDAGPGTGMASLAVRLGAGTADRAERSEDLATVMSLRGTPHIHRRDDLATVRAAMTTTDRTDLEAICGPLPDAVADRDDPVGELAEAMAGAIDELPSGETIAKADLSAAITPRLDAPLTPFCERCGVEHPIDGLFRLATLRAWLELVPDGRRQTFARARARSPMRPAAADVGEARAALVLVAARSAAPHDRDQLADWLGWSPVSVDEALDGSPRRHRHREPKRSVRLLPARDIWLRGSDRDWLLGRHVDRRGEVFKSLAAPGVLLAGGEIVGTWRQRKAGKALEVEVTPWRRLRRAERDEAEADAVTIAATRGLEVRPTFA